MAKDRVKAIELQVVNSADIAIDTWVAFDTIALDGVGLEGACFFIKINNDSSAGVYISYDGINVHDFVHSYSDYSVNFQTNSSPGNQVSKMSKGTIVYAQGVAGQGDIYLSGFYNE